MGRGLLLGVAALLAGPATAAGFLGLYYNAPPGADEYGMRIAAAQGAETIRLPIRWSHVQATPSGAYDWREYDATVLLAAAYDIEVMVTVHGTPDWAASREPEGGAPHNEAPPRPDTYPEYRAYLRALVERYRPGGDLWRDHPGAVSSAIRTWEIANEPNTARFWTAGEPDARAYAVLALVSARTIRKADPAAEVVIGSTSASCEHICPAAFLRTVLAFPGVAASTQAVSFHAYRQRPRDVLGEARVVREAVTAADSARTPLHLTEFGWGSCRDPERNLCVGAERQARRLTEAFGLLHEHRNELRLEAAQLFIQVDLEPCRDPAEVFCTFGLLSVGAKGHPAPKPGWSAYRDLAGQGGGLTAATTMAWALRRVAPSSSGHPPGGTESMPRPSATASANAVGWSAGIR